VVFLFGNKYETKRSPANTGLAPDFYLGQYNQLKQLFLKTVFFRIAQIFDKNNKNLCKKSKEHIISVLIQPFLSTILLHEGN